ncbi:MAG: hypothetical protein B6I30_07280, partial [Desulfobacteraceae bacterium 4572_187]
KPLSGKARFCFAKDLHTLLRLGADSESFPFYQIMRRLLTGYAVTFNRRHRRYGRLFLSEA